MTYSPILLVHIVTGMLGVLSGSMAFIVRKGSRLHRKAGTVFVVSMMLMGSTGAYIGATRSQPVNVLAGTLTVYLVASAWLTARRRPGSVGRAEMVLMIVAATAGIGAWISGVRGINGAAIRFVFGSVLLLSAAGDLRMLIRGGVAGPKRMVRHVWRMGFALFIASGSFFLGRSSDPVSRTAGLRARLFDGLGPLPAVPVLLVVALTIFWVFRVRLGRAYRTPPIPAPAP